MKDTYRTNHQDQCYQNSTNLWSTLSVYRQLCPEKCYVMQWLGHKKLLGVNIPAWIVIKLTNSHSTYGSPYFQSFCLKNISHFIFDNTSIWLKESTLEFNNLQFFFCFFLNLGTNANVPTSFWMIFLNAFTWNAFKKIIQN